MKISKLIWIGITSILFGCNDLDISPMNIVNDDDIFGSESGMMAYISRMYSDLPLDEKNGKPDVDMFVGDVITWDFVGYGYTNPNGSSGGYWSYGSVRNINYFLQEFPKHTSSFSEEKINTWRGEVLFMRALTYFAMTMRYGGVPIVKEPVMYTGQPIESLRVPRDKEVECYDFILSDLDEAISILPEKSPQVGRANKYIAYGLKARVALWAASIAKYSTIQLNGLLGVPAEQAQKYYQIAYDSALETAKGGYELYNDGSGDLAASYPKIFLDESSKETMFMKIRRYPYNGTGTDMRIIPWQLRGPKGYSSRANPTLDFVEMFDDVDGNPFILNAGTDDNPVLYKNRKDVFEKAEPRLKGIVIFPDDEFKGEVIDVRKGIVPAGEPISNYRSTASFTDMYENMTIQGASGMGGGETTVTGFYLRKYLDPNIPKGNMTSDRSETPWINMRYAEMLLIRAEAAIELNRLGDNSKMNDAVECMNRIRERAGSKKRFTADELMNTEDPTGISPKGTYLVRRERRLELCFESKLYWDFIRWRIFDKEVSNRQWKALYPIFVWDEQKYYMQRAVWTGWTFNFDPTFYYYSIPGIDKNPLLEQNPGY